MPGTEPGGCPVPEEGGFVVREGRLISVVGEE